MYLFKTPTKNKRGTAALKTLMGIGVSLAVIAITFTMAFLVMTSGKQEIVSLDGINESDASTYTTAYNGTTSMITGVAEFPDWMPIIVLVLVGVAVLLAVKIFQG